MRVLACVLRGAVRLAARVAADERCATAQTMQTSARACARRVRGAARTPRGGGNCHATRAPSVQRVYIGGVCKQARILPLLRSRRCSTPAAVRRTVLASFLLHSWLLVGNMEAYPVQSADMRERQAFQPQPEAIIDQPEASCGSQQQQSQARFVNARVC